LDFEYCLNGFTQRRFLSIADWLSSLHFNLPECICMGWDGELSLWINLLVIRIIRETEIVVMDILALAGTLR